MLPEDFRKRLEEAVWRDYGSAAGGWKKYARRVLRSLIVLLRDNARGELSLRAMGLVYTMLLSLVPLLALSFSILKAFGVHNQIRPFLLRVLAPLGEQSAEVTDLIVSFINNMNVGVLGFMGLALLLYTAVSLVQKVEEAFNFIWHVAQPRSFGQRFSRYLTLLVVAPVLVLSALSITAAVMNAEIIQWILAVEPFGWLVVRLGVLMPYLLIIAAFSLAYYFIPNTRVRPAAALLGGCVAGIAWQTAGWVFAEFAGSSSQYQAIYSGFAILIFFMIWLYLCWRILLLGASIAFYYQHPEYLMVRSGEPRVSNRMRERLALGIMSQIAGHFISGQPPLAVEQLARQLTVPNYTIAVVLDVLEENGLLTRVDNASSSYLPTRDLATVSLGEFLEIVRSAGEARHLSPANIPLDARVEEIIRRIDETRSTALAGLSLVDIAAIPAGETLPTSRAV